MVRKVLFSLLIIPMLFSDVSYGKGKEKESERPGSAIFVMAIPTEIEILDEPIYKKTKEMVVNLHIPSIKGLTDKKTEKQINKQLKSRALELQDEVKRIKKQNKTTDSVYEVISNYKIKESLDHYLTFSLFDYVYTSGTEGITHQSYMVVDTSNNKILTLKDLFRENIDYKETINSLIQSQIIERHAKENAFYSNILCGIKIQEDQSFYIEPNGDLVIVINVDQITPYASGSISFTLNKESLDGYIHQL